MLDQTKVKRNVIILIYVLLLIAIGVMVYFIQKPEATCSDGIRNQAEKGIDCGGQCSPCKEIVETKDLDVQEVAIADGGNGTFDVVAKISNPNDSVGAREFSYVFSMKDAGGNTIASQNGKTFILPADSRYVAVLGLSTANNAVPASADIAISDVRWEKLSGIGKPQIGVYSKKFGKSPAGDVNEAEGIIRNESSYDLGAISIVVILRDEKGKVVGINTTKKDSVGVKEERDFILTWPYALNSTVQKMEVDPQSNVFELQDLSI